MFLLLISPKMIPAHRHRQTDTDRQTHIHIHTHTHTRTHTPITTLIIILATFQFTLQQSSLKLELCRAHTPCACTSALMKCIATKHDLVAETKALSPWQYRNWYILLYSDSDYLWHSTTSSIKHALLTNYKQIALTSRSEIDYWRGYTSAFELSSVGDTDFL